MTMEASSTAEHMGGVCTPVQSSWGRLPGGRMFILRAEEQIRDRQYGKKCVRQKEWNEQRPGGK